MDRLVDDVFGLQDIVDYTVPVILLACAVIDDPVAVNDELEDVLASFAHWRLL